MKFIEIFNTFLRGDLPACLPVDLHKSGGFSHIPASLFPVFHGVKRLDLRLLAVLALSLHLGDQAEHLII
ncbi:hypothetical protein, partial [Candidatus Avelusimicrobium fimicolum]|uniref:hypothetical protein n=1 Tax=Candidatus Avelusimicrobium fimicolum TaxID=3416216 RepID=UPI003D0F26B4